MEQRTIKFKAKCLGNGEWVEGDILHTETLTFITWFDCGFRKMTEVDPSIVCQFTGLKDKNGKEIWEHDIVKDDNNSFEIIYAKGGFVFKTPTGIIPMMGTIMDEEKLVYFTNLGSKFDRKEEK